MLTMRTLVTLGSIGFFGAWALGCAQDRPVDGVPGAAGSSGSSGASGSGGTSSSGGASGKGGAGSTGGTSPKGGAGGSSSKGGASGSNGAGSTGGGGASSGAGSAGGSDGAGAGSMGGAAATGGTGGTGKGGTSAAGDSSAGGDGSMAGTSSAGGDASTGGSGGDATGGTSQAGGSSSVSCDLPAGYANGSVTFYTFSQGSTAVNCGFDIQSSSPDVVAYVPYGNGQFFGAMNTADYDTAATCGACVEVDRADTGQSVQLMIVDQCPTDSNPKCITGHIDLSEAAFLQIGQASEGYLGTTNGGAVGQISWKYIPCVESGTVNFRLKEPTNQYWNQILVEGHRTPIAMVEAYVNGAWMPGVRQSYNYWQVADGNMGPAPYMIRATDVNGSQVTASLNLAAGDQDSGQQFAACQ